MSKMGDQAKKMKTQIWSSVVTIVLIEGTKLLPMDDNGYSDPYVKFRLGNERYKSKVCDPHFVVSLCVNLERKKEVFFIKITK